MKANNRLGDVYEQGMDKELRKSMGQYYTPDFIIKYILENTLDNVDVLENPFITVVDISCGAGYFLLEAYDRLKKKFLLNIDELKTKYVDNIYEIKENGNVIKLNGSKYWDEKNIHYHILKHCIFGADIDPVGVELTKLGLISKKANTFAEELNIVQCDSLVKWERDFKWRDIKTQLENSNHEDNLILEYNDGDGKWLKKIIKKKEAIEIYKLGEFWDRKYDIIIGNPPYMGHKQISSQYKKWLLHEYKNVFKDKSDLSFCFFERIIDIMSPDGISGIITSRYFMESPTGSQLRSFLLRTTDIRKIVDFYGGKIFKDAGIATAIYFFKLKKCKNKEIKVKRLRNDNYIFSNVEDLKSTMDSEIFQKFTITEAALTKDRWLLLSKEENSIFNKIQRNTRYKLDDIGLSFQGVITGRDRAFILNSNEIEENKIEKELLKPWIKNSNVGRYDISSNDQYIIYSDLIKCEDDFPNSIKYIGKHKHRLMERRECRRGTRKWYQLQWGRDKELFKQDKIVFPYKANSNRFAIDYKGHFSSADVYSMIIRDGFQGRISLEYLVGLLNSSIYEFYFKLFAKKMGKGIYDYYPNSVMDLKIITCDIVNDIEKKSRKIMKLILKKDDKSRKKIAKLEEEIDLIIANHLDLSENEHKLIKDSINQ